MPRASDAAVVAARPSRLDSATPRARFEAYLAGSEVLLTSVIEDGYADFIDSLRGAHIRAEDAGDAILRLAAVRHAIVAEVEAGRLTPRAFGASAWHEVPPQALADLAEGRLRGDDDFDVDAAIRALLLDPSWRKVNLRLPSHGGGRPLTPDATSAPFQRSVISYLLPDQAAAMLADDEVWQAMALGAATGDPASARLHAVHALAEGVGELAPIVGSTLMSVLVESARLNPFESVTPLESHERAPDTRDGRSGTVELRGLRLGYMMKRPEIVATEVRRRLAAGQLDDLSAADRRMLADLTEPGLEARLRDQRWRRGWREFGAAAVEMTMLAAASGGVGALAEGVAVGARATDFGVRASRFAATTLSFTTVAGLRSGELRPQAYLRDAAMFKALGLAGRFARVIDDLFAHGRFAYAVKPLAYGASSLTAGGVLTVYETLRHLADEDELQGHLLERFVRNVALVSVVCGAHQALYALAPHLAPGSAARAEHARLQARLSVLAEQAELELAALSRVAHPMAYTHPGAVAAAVRRAETNTIYIAGGPPVLARAPVDAAAIDAALTRLDHRARAFAVLVDDVLLFARRTAPDHLPAVERALVEHAARLERYAFSRMADLAGDPMRPQVAGGLSRPIPDDMAIKLAEGEVAIFSRDLAPGLGLDGPRPPPADPAEVRRRLIGDTPSEADFIRLAAGLPELAPHEVQGVGRYRLVSESHNGSGPSVYYGQLRVESDARPVAIKVFPSFGAYEAKESVHAHLLGELGIGPRVYGLGEVCGRKAIVMDAIRGDMEDVVAVGRPALQDLERALDVMRRAGISVGDFQFLVTPDGRAVLMDAGGVISGGPMDVRAANRRIAEILDDHRVAIRDSDGGRR